MVKFHHSEFEKFEYNINSISQQLFKSWPYFGGIFSALREFISDDSAIIMLTDNSISSESLVNNTDYLSIFMTNLNEALAHIVDLETPTACFVDADKISISELVRIMPTVKKTNIYHSIILVSNDNLGDLYTAIPSNIADGCICLRRGSLAAGINMEIAAQTSKARLDAKSQYSLIS